MGISERKEREKAERKILIMRCAKELILQHGVEKVSMIEIAEKAELSKATLYLYFPGKEALFEEICNEAAVRFLEYFRKRLDAEKSSIKAIQIFWLCYLELFGESEDMIIIFKMKNYISPGFPFLQQELKKQPSADSFVALLLMIKTMLEKGIEEGFFDPSIDMGETAGIIISLFSYIVENAARLPKETRQSLSIIGEMRSVFEIILRGIAREGIDRSVLKLPGIGEINQR
ncbi:MAG: TetR/AcrR family transcriptional regulator [Treponema sp.]|jgi:AcrR family transcriptional regulator|nr:TetR/AcrR family transcriptional regulator [Treponema sp.]